MVLFMHKLCRLRTDRLICAQLLFLRIPYPSHIKHYYIRTDWSFVRSVFWCLSHEKGATRTQVRSLT